jgi:hypothetical protein
MQEMTLARKLVDMWQLQGRDAERLIRWDEASSVEKGHLGRSGCLGTEVEKVAMKRVSCSRDMSLQAHADVILLFRTHAGPVE